MRPKRLARLIWLGAGIVLVGDVIGWPWSDILRMLVTPDIDHVTALVAIVYAQVRALILSLSVLGALSVIVETLGKIQREAAG